MPRDLDDIQDMEPASSTGPALDAAAPEPKGEEAVTAASSPATDAQQPEKDVLSVVRDVVSERKPDPEASSAKAEEDGAPAPEGKSPEKQDDEEYSDVPFNKHPRFQQLLRERKEFKADATRYRNIENFLETNGVEAEEAAEALTVAALAKTDPVACWARIKPWVQQVLVAAGEVLPEDLQGRVAAGELSQEAAFEVSRSRATVQTVQTQRTFAEQQAERRAQQEAHTALMTTAQTWEADRRAKDPNFEAKYGPLQREIAYLIQTEGRPTTPDGVKAQLQKAYAAVNASFRPPAPVAPTPAPAVKPAIRPVTSGQVAAQAQPEPNSVLDIVRAHTRRAG